MLADGAADTGTDGLRADVDDDTQAMMRMATESLVHRIHALDVTDVHEAAVREEEVAGGFRGEVYYVADFIICYHCVSSYSSVVCLVWCDNTADFTCVGGRQKAASIVWRQRIRMALDVVSGLVYLHSFSPAILRKD